MWLKCNFFFFPSTTKLRTGISTRVASPIRKEQKDRDWVWGVHLPEKLILHMIYVERIRKNMGQDAIDGACFQSQTSKNPLTVNLLCLQRTYVNFIKALLSNVNSVLTDISRRTLSKEKLLLPVRIEGFVHESEKKQNHKDIGICRS